MLKAQVFAGHFLLTGRAAEIALKPALGAGTCHFRAGDFGQCAGVRTTGVGVVDKLLAFA